MPLTILIPLPKRDFDPTECAVPWLMMKQTGLDVRFATSDGETARCDERMLLGAGLGILSSVLSADDRGFAAYSMMEQSPEFLRPLRWSEIKVADFAGLILPGGHAPGMKEYLESVLLQKIVGDFFKLGRPVGAICHGVVLAARSQIDGKSVLHGRKTTALLATQELLAWRLTRLWLGNYYRTYNETVEHEVRTALAAPEHFVRGPLPLFRDQPEKLNRGFCVRDGSYLSARWPGDAHRFATDFVAMVSPKP